MNTCIFSLLARFNPSIYHPYHHFNIIAYYSSSFFHSLNISNNYIRYTVIIYWETTHVMSNHSWSVSHATSMQPLCNSHTPQRTIATVTRHSAPSQQSRDTNATLMQQSHDTNATLMQQSHDTSHHRKHIATHRKPITHVILSTLPAYFLHPFFIL